MKKWQWIPAVLLAIAPASSLFAADPTVADAFTLVPTQKGVDFDQPTAGEQAKCTLTEAKEASGWVVRDANGRTLRRFLDTNSDQKLDQWCYYKDNIEVYRDIDTDANRVADQCRWLGTGGTRWGIDKNEDGNIDSWRLISPEEVSLVAIQAIRGQDAKLFESLLLTADELKELGLPAAQSDKIRARIQLAQREFSKWSQDQQAVEKDSRWLHFGGGQPALLPQGPGGGKRDIVVYDNTAAVVETGGEHTQIQIGSLVQIGSTWRLLGLPKVLSESDLASAGLFFGQSYQTTAGGQTSSGGFSQQMQDLLAKLEEVDKELLATSSAAAQARLQGQRADLMEKLAGASGNPEDKKTWLRQLADTMSAAVQNGDYAGGVERLTKLVATVEQLDDTSLTAYVEFRLELSKYSIQLSKSNADFSKVQDRWLKALEGFVKKYPQAIDSAEAMLQLGLAREFTGESSAAIGWYDQIVKSFADTEHGKKAAGAKTRLQSVGKTIRLAAATLDNKKVDLSAYRGRPVVVHYWSTLSGTGAKDEATLKNLQAKYGRKLGILGVNLDTSRQAAVNHVKQARISWPQLFEEGGRDSRLANEMGILTLPTTFLIDDQGRLISHSIHTGELDGELKKLIR